MVANAGPSTPPNIPHDVQPLSITDTPHAQGSGSHSSYHSRHHQSHYKPYLREDLRNQHTITMDQFLCHILQVPSALLQKKVAPTIQGLQKAVHEYTSTFGHETMRYHSFVKVANLIISETINTLDIIFCRNDPVIVKASFGDRKPDVVGVCYDAVREDGDRGGVDNLINDGPKGYAFYWSELLSFLEFKVNRFVGGGSSVHTSSVSSGVSSRSNLVAPTASLLAGSSSKFRAKKLAPANVANTRTVAATRSSTSSKRPSGGDVSRETSRKSKRRKKDADVDVDELQCASYALELLSHGGLRNHVVGALVSDNSLQLLYYDRSIILISEPFDFIVDHSHLVITLNALARFNARQWGYTLPPLEPGYSLPEPRDRDRLFDGLRLTLKNGRQLRLMDTIFHQHSLIGRGTCVVRATCVGAEVNKSDRWEGTVIVKFSWPSKSRMAEPTIIEEARQMAVESGDNWVLDHLPI